MRTTWWALTAALGVAVVAGLPRADAVPAFARREGVTCQMCHFRPPELNQDGHDYVRRGLREKPGGMGAMASMGKTPAPQSMPEMPGMAMPPAAGKPAALGTPLALPEGEYWTLLAHPAVVVQRGAEPEFQRGVIDLWLIGPRDPHWSAVANPNYDLDAEESGWDQAYAQYITHWDRRFESARGGRVLPFAILLNQGGPSMALSTPLVLSTPADTGNPWTPATLLRAAEVGAVNLPQWSAYLGAGRPVLEDSEGVRAHTDIYASAERLLGSAGDSLSAYGYWGKGRLSPGTRERGFHRVGLFGNVYRRQQKWVAGYVTGRDTTADRTQLDSRGWFLFGEQLLSTRWAAYARYDGLRQDLLAGGARTIRGPALGASWWARTQVWLTGEAQFLDSSGQGRERTFTVELLWAF